MKKILTLTENDIVGMVSEAVREVSLSTVKSAAGKYDSDVEDAIRTIEGELERYGSGYSGGNAMHSAAVEGLAAVKAYFQRKQAQSGYMSDVAYSASSMRDGDDSGQITSDEYRDADDSRARASLASSINNSIKAAVRGKFPTAPDGMLPKAEVLSDSRVDVSVWKRNYDSVADAVTDAMSSMGYSPDGSSDSGHSVTLKFTKSPYGRP